MSYQGELKENQTKPNQELRTENSRTELLGAHFLDAPLTLRSCHTEMKSECFSS